MEFIFIFTLKIRHFNPLPYGLSSNSCHKQQEYRLHVELFNALTETFKVVQILSCFLM